MSLGALDAGSALNGSADAVEGGVEADGRGAESEEEQPAPTRRSAATGRSQEKVCFLYIWHEVYQTSEGMLS